MKFENYDELNVFSLGNSYNKSSVHAWQFMGSLIIMDEGLNLEKPLPKPNLNHRSESKNFYHILSSCKNTPNIYKAIYNAVLW